MPGRDTPDGRPRQAGVPVQPSTRCHRRCGPPPSPSQPPLIPWTGPENQSCATVCQQQVLPVCSSLPPHRGPAAAYSSMPSAPPPRGPDPAPGPLGAAGQRVHGGGPARRSACPAPPPPPPGVDPPSATSVPACPPAAGPFSRHRGCSCGHPPGEWSCDLQPGAYGHSSRNFDPTTPPTGHRPPRRTSSRPGPATCHGRRPEPAGSRAPAAGPRVNPWTRPYLQPVSQPARPAIGDLAKSPPRRQQSRRIWKHRLPAAFLMI